MPHWGVKEVWRWHNETLTAHELQYGNYRAIETSHHFPNLQIADVMGFLAQRTQIDENTLIRTFREWARNNMAEN